MAWQGTQLRLCAAALDSLKRELARERATASSAREEARRSDSVAEQAPRMMHALCTCMRACTLYTAPHAEPHRVFWKCAKVGSAKTSLPPKLCETW